MPVYPDVNAATLYSELLRGLDVSSDRFGATQGLDRVHAFRP